MKIVEVTTMTVLEKGLNIFSSKFALPVSSDSKELTVY